MARGANDIALRCSASAGEKFRPFLHCIGSLPTPLVGYVSARTTAQAAIDPAAAPDASLELCLDAAIVAAG